MTLIITTNIEARMGERKAKFVNPIYLSIMRQLLAPKNYQPPTQRAGISKKIGVTGTLLRAKPHFQVRNTSIWSSMQYF